MTATGSHATHPIRTRPIARTRARSLPIRCLLVLAHQRRNEEAGAEFPHDRERLFLDSRQHLLEPVARVLGQKVVSRIFNAVVTGLALERLARFLLGLADQILHDGLGLADSPLVTCLR